MQKRSDVAKRYAEEEKILPPHDPNGYEGELPHLMPSSKNGHSRRQSEIAHDLQTSYRKKVGKESELFIRLGLISYKMREKSYFRALGYDTFNEWLASPEQNTEPTKGNLQAQVIKLCLIYFRLHVTRLNWVGFKKWMIITPRIEAWYNVISVYDLKIEDKNERVKEAEAAGDSQRYEMFMDSLEQLIHHRNKLWAEYREKVDNLITQAETLSSSALTDDGDAGGGFETAYRGQLSMSDLRSYEGREGGVTELLAALGLSDFTDRKKVYITVKYNK